MKKSLLEFLAVAGGGALGTLFRFVIGNKIITWSAFPLGTFVINITGSLFLGFFMTLINDRVITINDYLRLAVATGFVGAYTTFSTYMFESDKMLQDAPGLRAILYILGSVIVGLFAVRSGVILAKWL